MVKTLPSNAEGAGLFPGQGPKIPQASQQKTKTWNRSSIATNSLKTLKMIHINSNNKNNNLKNNNNNNIDLAEPRTLSWNET